MGDDLTQIAEKYRTKWERQTESTMDPNYFNSILSEMDVVQQERDKLSQSSDLNLFRAVATYQRQLPGLRSLRSTAVEFLSLEGEDWLSNIAERFFEPNLEQMRTIYDPFQKKYNFGYMSQNLVKDYHGAR